MQHRQNDPWSSVNTWNTTISRNGLLASPEQKPKVFPIISGISSGTTCSSEQLQFQICVEQFPPDSSLSTLNLYYFLVA
jgi:hypothetical protein